MSKRLKYTETMSLRLLPGTFVRLDKARLPDEDRADVVRAAIDNELERREQQKPRARAK